MIDTDKITTRHYAAAILVLVVICVIYYIATMNAPQYNAALGGLWVADPTFCERAEISSMLLFIGDELPGGEPRNGYIIVIDEDDSVVTNQGFSIDIRGGWAGPLISTYSTAAKIEFDDENLWTGDDSIAAVTLQLDVIEGVLRVMCGDELYARLHRTPM